MQMWRVLSVSCLVGADAFTIGAEVEISSISPCPSFCGGSGATFDSDQDGGGGDSAIGHIGGLGLDGGYDGDGGDAGA